MKIKQEHYEHMKNSMTPIMQAIPQPEGMSDKMYRWAVARKAGLITYMCDELYSYLNDDHIDTALRKITGAKQ